MTQHDVNSPCVSTPQGGEHLKRVLPAAQYDALKAAAEKNGGVGSADFFDSEGKGKCGYGLACDAGLLTMPTEQEMRDQYGLGPEYGFRVMRETWLFDQSTACALPFGYEDSDDAVRAVRNRLAAPLRPERVPFDAWAEELGLIRGE